MHSLASMTDGAVGVEIRADRFNLAVDDANVERAISAARRVDQSAAFN